MKWVAISLVLLAFLCMPSKSQNDTTTSPPTNQTTLNTTTPVPTDATNTTNSTTSDTESLLAAVIIPAALTFIFAVMTIVELWRERKAVPPKELQAVSPDTEEENAQTGVHLNRPPDSPSSRKIQKRNKRAAERLARSQTSNEEEILAVEQKA